MTIVADVAEGEEIIRQLKNYDNVYLSDKEFGKLSFKVDFNDVTGYDRKCFMEALTEIHPDLETWIDDDNHITCEYYITADILPRIRDVVTKYCDSFYGGYLYYFKYEPPRLS